MAATTDPVPTICNAAAAVTSLRATTSAPVVKRMGLNHEMVQIIHGSDQNMYLVLLTFGTLHIGDDASPKPSISYRIVLDGSKGALAPPPASVLFAITTTAKLSTGLLAGRLKEWNIASSMFAMNDQSETEVGVHIFHVEKYEAWNQGIGLSDGCRPFAEFTLNDMAEVTVRNRWTRVGFFNISCNNHGRTKAEHQDEPFKPMGHEEVFEFTAKSGGNNETVYITPGQEDFEAPLEGTWLSIAR